MGLDKTGLLSSIRSFYYSYEMFVVCSITPCFLLAFLLSFSLPILNFSFQYFFKELFYISFQGPFFPNSFVDNTTLGGIILLTILFQYYLTRFLRGILRNREYLSSFDGFFLLLGFCWILFIIIQMPPNSLLLQHTFVILIYYICILTIVLLVQFIFFGVTNNESILFGLMIVFYFLALDYSGLIINPDDPSIFYTGRFDTQFIKCAFRKM